MGESHQRIPASAGAPRVGFPFRASLMHEGCRDALILWKETATLLDGHNRLRICEERDLPFETVELSLPDRDSALLWIINNQNGRRNLSDDQRAVLALKRQQIMSEIAKRERAQKANDKKYGHSSLSDTLTDKEKPCERGKDRHGREIIPKRDTRSQAAAEFKTSERKVRQAAAVEKAAPEKLKAVLDGKTKLADAVRETKRAVLKTKLAEVAAREIEAPTGEYDVIVCATPSRHGRDAPHQIRHPDGLRSAKLSAWNSLAFRELSGISSFFSGTGIEHPPGACIEDSPPRGKNFHEQSGKEKGRTPTPRCDGDELWGVAPSRVALATMAVPPRAGRARPPGRWQDPIG